MAIIDRDPLLPLPPAVRGRINSLRAAVRRYVWLEGLAALAVWLGLLFWASMALDWLFEPPLLVREILLAAAFVVLAWVAFRYILRRTFVPLSDSNMATVLERRFPELNDSLLTTVLLSHRSPERTGFNLEMLATTGDRAAQQVAATRIGEVFDPMPVARKLVVALGLAAIAGLLAWQAPDVLGLWAQRNLLLAEKMWPKKIRLEVFVYRDGKLAPFRDGAHTVGKGENADLRVRAFRGDTEIPVLPERVEIRYRSEGGNTERRTMKSIGAADSSAARKDQVLQEYGYQFTGLLSTVHFDILGGDASVRNLAIQVVANPTMELSLVCKYPDYMELPPAPIQRQDPTLVPVGSLLTVSGTSTKPLERLSIDCPAGEQRSALHLELTPDQLRGDRNIFSQTFDPFPNPPISKQTPPPDVKPATEAKSSLPPSRDCNVQFTLRDTDGIKSRDPILLNMVAVPAQAPEFNKVQLYGNREPVVTAKGRLAATGTLSFSDDYGRLGRAWWDYAIEQPPKPPAPGQPPEPAAKPATPRTGEATLAKLSGHPRQFVLKEQETSLEASDLKLAEGQKLTVTIRAADLCNLGAGPNVGSSESWQLDVVSDDQLLTRLEARELLLRQRFEPIVQEMSETRNLLLKMDFAPPDKGSTAPKAREAGAEPGEAPPPVQNLSAADLTARRLERTRQALLNSAKNAAETWEIADGVDQIRLQLTNNRVDSEERKTRLDANVSRPLHNIVEEMFPELTKRLNTLEESVGDLAIGPGQRDKARQQADAILAQMENVLRHMIVMEDFNVAVVQRLQKLIEQQRELNELTKKKDAENLGEKE